MQLDFTPDQEELRASVRSVLEKECPRTLVREHVELVVRGEPSDAFHSLIRPDDNRTTARSVAGSPAPNWTFVSRGRELTP